MRHMLLKRLNSCTAIYISRPLVPCGSRMDSTLSRTRIISPEDRNGCKKAKSLGLSIPAPMTSESRLRKLGSDAGNRSQWMNRRLLPNRFLMRSSWRTVSVIVVLPIPPAPMRAMGLRFSARLTTFSINSFHPKMALGGCGGGSPCALDANMRLRIHRLLIYFSAPIRTSSLTLIPPLPNLTVCNECHRHVCLRSITQHIKKRNKKKKC